jgi:cytochrome c peroxidase
MRKNCAALALAMAFSCFIPNHAQSADVNDVQGRPAIQSQKTSQAEFVWNLPPWAPRPVVPADNPMNTAKVELGRRLFYDREMSASGAMACASCHDQAKAFSDGQRVPIGISGVPGPRNAMSLTNVAYLPVLTWANPTLTRLELQAIRPMFGLHPVEMGMFGREDQIFARLGADPTYRQLFASAFPKTRGDINLTAVVRALAAFERTLLSFDSPYDRYKYAGDANAISDQAKRGETLFFGERLQCGRCHSGLNLTDNLVHEGRPRAPAVFHNTGLHNLDGNGVYPSPNHGIHEITKLPGDEGRMRTPSLRNIALTAPYMHDGSLSTLRDVVLLHYAQQGYAVARGQAPNPLRSRFIGGFEISEPELEDLMAFLGSLTDAGFVTAPGLSDPFMRVN